MKVQDLITTDNIIKINSSELHCLEVLEVMANNLLENNLVYNTFSNAVKEREKVFPTGLELASIGIAIPHADSEFVKKTGIGIGILSEPVIFNTMGDPDSQVSVKLVFMLAVKEKNKQVELLQFLMNLLEYPDLLNDMYYAKNKVEIIQVLADFEKKFIEE